MIIPFVMYQSGPIPGLEGTFAGGQTVYVDDETNTVVSSSLILQAPHNVGSYATQPLAEPEGAQPLTDPETDGGIQ